MVVDADSSVIGPHSDALLKAGFGYSCVEIDAEGDDESAREMLLDWGWTAKTEPPCWLQNKPRGFE